MLRSKCTRGLVRQACRQCQGQAHLSGSLSLAPGRRAFKDRASSGPVALLQKERERLQCIPRHVMPAKELCASNDGDKVIVSGWLASIRRVSRNLSFAVILLPRGQGRIQVVARTDGDEANVNADQWDEAGVHGVIYIEGTLHSRPQDAIRQGKTSNDLDRREIRAVNSQIINAVAPGSLPFDPLDSNSALPREELRSRFRHLDLRRPSLGDNIRLRSKITQAIRNSLHNRDFTEIETPILLRSTPEGAREYMVPTRLPRSAPSKENLQQEPQFYALQQSPQQPKQLLVISGVTDRYFQIARCFRDEDGRKDRQPEFTQIDLEMSFVRCKSVDQSTKPSTIGSEEIRDVVENLIRDIWRAAGRRDEWTSISKKPFRVMSYTEAMERFGSDKPDLRYGMEIVSLSKALRDVSDDSDAVAPDSEVEVLSFTPSDSLFSTKDVKDLLEAHRDILGNVEAFKTDEGSHNVLAKLLLRQSRNVRDYLERIKDDVKAEDVSIEAVVEQLREASVKGSVTSDTEEGEKTWTFVATRRTPAQGGSTKLGELRRLLAQHLERKAALDLNTFLPQFVWIVDFPLFTRADEDKAALSGNRWSSSHHPFTMPKADEVATVMEVLADNHVLTREEEVYLSRVGGQHYDLVLNGVEIGGGSVRIHDAELQRRILANMLQLTEAELGRFRHLLEALSMGAPPHAGIALGFDRLMAILCDTQSIRDVIAFPKSANGRDLLFGSPDAIDAPATMKQDGSEAGVDANEILAQYGLRKA